MTPESFTPSTKFMKEMIEYLQERPCLVSAIGCALTSVFAFYSKTAFVILFVISILWLLVVIFKKRAKAIISLTLIIIMQISCCITFFETQSQNRLAGKTVQADIVFTGEVYKSSSYYGSKAEVINSSVLKKGTKLMLWHTPATFADGSVLSAEIKLDEINLKYKASNYSEKIYLNGNIVEIKATDSVDPVMKAIGKIRKYVKNAFFKNLSYDSAATLTALIAGDRGYFRDEFYSSVKGAGVAHVMVVSGMHLAILVSLLLKFCEKIFYNRFFRSIVMFAVVILLLAVCGFTMSVMRAGITYIIMAVGLALNRPYSGENALGLAVSLILIDVPFAVFSVSFVLSVLSTFGILAVAIPVINYIKNYKIALNKTISAIMQSVIISLSALLLTLPVVIFVFGYVSTVGVIANLLISLPVTFCMGIAVVALVINLICPPLANVLFCCLEIVTEYVNGVINYFGNLSFSVWRLPYEFGFIAILFIIVTFWILLACKKRMDMLKLKKMNIKVIKERGSLRKWQSFLKKH